jgi:hypothetical protein
MMQITFRMSCVLILFLSNGLLPAQNIRLLTPETMEFGRLQEGQTVEGRIQFVNTGKAPIEIQNIQTSCGCTATQVEKMRYEPGDTATIRYTIRTKGFRGVVRKTITVHFTDPDMKELYFIAQGTLYADIEVTPPFIDFQGVPVRPDTSFSRTVTLRNNSPKPIQIKSAYSKSKLLAVSPMMGVVPPGESLAMIIQLMPSNADSRDTDVWIETDSASRPLINIPVFIQIGKK